MILSWWCRTILSSLLLWVHEMMMTDGQGEGIIKKLLTTDRQVLTNCYTTVRESSASKEGLPQVRCSSSWLTFLADDPECLPLADQAKQVNNLMMTSVDRERERERGHHKISRVLLTMRLVMPCHRESISLVLDTEMMTQVILLLILIVLWIWWWRYNYWLVSLLVFKSHKVSLSGFFLFLYLKKMQEILKGVLVKLTGVR